MVVCFCLLTHPVSLWELASLFSLGFSPLLFSVLAIPGRVSPQHPALDMCDWSTIYCIVWSQLLAWDGKMIEARLKSGDH